MKRIAVLSTGRQDWGIVRSICQSVRADVELELLLAAGGMACSGAFGRIANEMSAEGFRVDELTWLSNDGSPEPSSSRQAALALEKVAAWLSNRRPDILVLAGDRFETLAAAQAATLEGIPIAHLHGGEETEGAVDNAIRHSITKLSHVHFVSEEVYAARVRAMGEDPAQVHVVGAPGRDNALRADLPSRAELEAMLGRALKKPVVIVTVHPTTLARDPAADARAVADAMRGVPASYVVTLPNIDSGHTEVCQIMKDAAADVGGSAVDALGERNYFGLMQIADAMLGNSSSALIEAPLYGLTAINVGDRQKGRLRPSTLIDIEATSTAIAKTLRAILAPSYRREAVLIANGGNIGSKIVSILKDTTISLPPRKRFHELSR